MKHKLSILRSQLKVRWQNSRRIKAAFETNNREWLNGTITLETMLPSPTSAGRPVKSFVTSSERSKRRKTVQLRSEISSETLTYATQMKLRETGEVHAAHVIKDLTKSPTRAAKYRRAFQKRDILQHKEQISPLEALYMFIQAGMTRDDYEIVRSIRKSLYPCYSIIQKAKSECLPPKDAYIISDISMEIKIQELLDLTAKRLMIHLKECMESLTQEEKNSIEIIYKWGCD